MRTRCKAGFQSHVCCNCAPDRRVDAAQPVDLPDDTPVRTQHGMTTLGEAIKRMTPTDQEVEAVARAIAASANSDDNRGDGWEEWRPEARAAIAALDQVRGK